jgi:hypothetical protein
MDVIGPAVKQDDGALAGASDICILDAELARIDSGKPSQAAE